ncbi:HAD family hydrolase [Streptomyces clavuligerus]|uniref:HAD family hydrolase n=1 Tax=Streptomyces clavuligerus TaxID=1901 RepID=UPI001C9BB26C|nr:HAD family phosphatase [Streptomyces clavuligerus]MBY6301415.1 HAD family phosphatase [Streptomyces clavuligerus]
MSEIFPWTPAAVVFDCDGTLMDSERHWVDARTLVLHAYDVQPDEEFTERAKGVHYTECGHLMAAVAGRPELAGEMTGRLLTAFRSLVAEDPVTTPGAEDMVERTARFAPLAVASNCPRDVVEHCLDTAGLLEYFRQVIVPEGVMRPKPHPDVYLTATERFDAEPGDCLAVEDSLCGIRSAVRAGLRVLGVGSDPDRESLAMADRWAPSLADPALLVWADSRALCGVAR